MTTTNNNNNDNLELFNGNDNDLFTRNNLAYKVCFNLIHIMKLKNKHHFPTHLSHDIWGPWMSFIFKKKYLNISNVVVASFYNFIIIEERIQPSSNDLHWQYYCKLQKDFNDFDNTLYKQHYNDFYH